MKYTASFFSLLFTTTVCCAADPVARVLPANYGEVVFMRQESTGKLNIVPARITCNMWERLNIKGGETAGLYLAEGKYEFQAFSTEPYDDNSDGTSCRSTVLEVKVIKGRRFFIEVIPQP